MTRRIQGRRPERAAGSETLCHWRIWAFIAVVVIWPHAAAADTITPERITAAVSKLEALAEGAVADGAVPGLPSGSCMATR